MLRYVFLAALLVATAPVSAQVVPGQERNLIDAVSPLAPALEDERIPGELARYRVEFVRGVGDAGETRVGDRVRVALPAAEQVYELTRVESFMPGTRSVSGVAVDGSGDVLALTLAADGAAGVVSAAGSLYHALWADGGPVLVRVDADHVDHLECDVTEDEVHGAAFDLSPEAMRAATAPFHMHTLGDYGDEHITIDVILAYTENARNWSMGMHGSIESVIGQMMNLSQLALDNSDTRTVIRIVHAYETDYDETIPDMTGVSSSGSHLRRFTASSSDNPWGSEAAGFMEEVHGLRDEYGADLASLLAHVSGFGGVAWLLGNIQGSPSRGFSVNRVQQMATGYTFVHEIGHNMGKHHSRNQTSSAAGPRGGIFPYSTGWRFDAPNDPQASSYATVMTYIQTGSPRVPFFSNPEVSYGGVPTGAYAGGGAPADNARSMRETRRIIANYRATLHEPPVASVTPEAIEVTLEPGETTTRAIQIANLGISDLMWEVDLLPVSLPGAAVATADGSGVSLEYDPSVPAISMGHHLSPSDALRDDGVIYETSFDATDGFSPGTHQHSGGWTARSDSGPFWVMTSNPSTGSQHIRMTSSNSTTSAWLHSPFFGAWPTGGYEFGADVSVSADGGPAYYLMMRDGRSGKTTAGVAILGNGTVFVFNGFTSGGADIFAPTGHAWPVAEYFRLTYRVRPDQAEVDYLIDDELVATQPLFAGMTFGQLQITRNPGSTSVWMDLDNVSIEQIHTGMQWLDVASYSGVTAAGSSTEVDLSFDSSPLSPGVHSAAMVIRTNDAEAPEIVVPVSLTIGTVGTENGAGADVDRLLGNHPNPARDATTIRYQLAQPGSVTLELFTLTGQRVAVLADHHSSVGTHEVRLDTGSLASGVYMYRLRTEATVETGRLVVVR